MSAKPFADSLQHLLAELERLDVMLRAQAAATRAALDEDPVFHGLHISEAEALALLRQPAGQPRWALATAPTEALRALRELNVERRERSLHAGIELRLPRLQQRFGLDDVDVDLLLLAMAVDLDIRYERLFAYLQDDATRRRPSVGLLIDLLATDGAQRMDARQRFEAAAPLRAARLIELADEPAGRSFLAHDVAVPARISAWLLGSDAIDERGIPGLRRTAGAAALADGVLDDGARESLQRLVREPRDEARRWLHFIGPPSAGKRAAALATAHDFGTDVLEIELDRLLADNDFERQCERLRREARLLALPLLARGFDALLAPPRRSELRRWLDLWRDHDGLLMTTGQAEFEPVGEWRDLPFERVRIAPLTGPARAAHWRTVLPELEAAGIDAIELAGRFSFSTEQVQDAAASLRRGLSRPGTPLDAASVLEACRRHSSPQMNSLARKIVPRHRWPDIVLPPDRLELLQDICKQMKHRVRVLDDWGFGRRLAMGKGLSVLFAGPSGTGKTLAADILAGELGLDLFRIDLASVVSKYIGETEKNLGTLFDEAQITNAILFFDEADALFGKRTDVRDAHDRHANVETSYLLQRLEAYEGMAILATNFRRNMDEAFVRRLHFTIEFPFPAAADRQRIWQHVWPGEVPRHDSVDAADLAGRLELSGGNIRNVALAAAFLAADEGGPIRLPHVMRAAQREFQKMGKLIDESAFTVAALAASGKPPLYQEERA